MAHPDSDEKFDDCKKQPVQERRRGFRSPTTVITSIVAVAAIGGLVMCSSHLQQNQRAELAAGDVTDTVSTINTRMAGNLVCAAVSKYRNQAGKMVYNLQCTAR